MWDYYCIIDRIHYYFCVMYYLSFPVCMCINMCVLL